VESTSTQDIFVVLIMPPFSGDRGMSLFDELVYTSCFSDYNEEEEEGEGLNQIQSILRDAAIYLQSITAYTTTCSTGNNTAKSNLNKKQI